MNQPVGCSYTVAASRGLSYDEYGTNGLDFILAISVATLRILAPVHASVPKEPWTARSYLASLDIPFDEIEQYLMLRSFCLDKHASSRGSGRAAHATLHPRPPGTAVPLRFFK